MRFNMGCGLRKLPGYVNVDASPAAEPDVLFDLDQTPWPWPDDCAEEVRFIHALEHMGASSAGFIAIMRELYRILRPGAEAVIHVPHPRHDNFLTDPTHVRAIFPQTLRLFDRRLNLVWRDAGFANSPLALYAGVDFQLLETKAILEEPYHSQLQRGEITAAEVEELARRQNNIATEFRIRMAARKPAWGVET